MPYSYARTSEDVSAEMYQDIYTYSERMPFGKASKISWCEKEYWPIPWYIRDYTAIGWWCDTTFGGSASAEHRRLSIQRRAMPTMIRLTK